MKNFVYYEETADLAVERPKPDHLLKIDYRGFPCQKIEGHSLYQIECPEGKDVPRSISGSYTKREALWTAIDQFISLNPETDPKDIYIDKPKVKPPRKYFKQHDKWYLSETEEEVPEEIVKLESEMNNDNV
jgi:hypothetical protein